MSDSISRIVEFYRNESSQRQLVLRPDRTTTLCMVGARPLTLLELPASLGFHDGSGVLLPTAPGGDALTSLDVVARALVHAAEFPQEQLLVAGHVPGQDAGLSTRRAEVVQAYLSGDREAWATRLQEDFAVEDWQRIIKWAAQALGWPTDPGKIDGKSGPKSRAALIAFREHHNKTRDDAIPTRGSITEDDWRAFFDAYDAHLASLFAESPAQLQARRDALQLVPAGGVGCGDAWSLDMVRIGNYDGTTHERVDLLFFDPKHSPKLKCHGDDGCNWKKCDVYRKGKYELVELEAEGEQTGPELKKVQILDLEEVNFHHDSCVMMPNSRAATKEGASQDRITGLAVIKTSLQFVALFPDKQLLIAGHTDTSGRESYNLSLSRLRAGNVEAFLRGDRERWAKTCQEKFQVEDWQQILKWVAETRGWDCDPGPITNQSNEPSRLALRRFRLRYSDEYPDDVPERGSITNKDWRAFYDLYEDDLAKQLKVPASELATFRSQVKSSSPSTVGCGESWPIEAVALDGFESKTNRRVEFLFFDPGEAPALSCHAAKECDPALCELYAPGSYRVEHLPADLDVLRTPAVGLRLPTRFSEGRNFPKPTALEGLKKIAERLRDDPSLTALVLGHTDSEEEQGTGLARAESVRAFLVGDAEFFVRRFDDPKASNGWEWEELNWMLAGTRFNDVPYHVGPVEDFDSRYTTFALRRFQHAHPELEVTLEADDRTLPVIVREYLDLVDVERPDSARVFVLDGGGSHEFLPIKGQVEDVNPYDEEPLRRVEVFLWRSYEPPLAHCSPNPHEECAAYARWCGDAEEVIVAEPGYWMTLRLVDSEGRPLSDHPIDLLEDDELLFSGKTSFLGTLELKAPPGVYGLRLERQGASYVEHVLVEADEFGGLEIAYPFAVGA